MTAQTRRSFLSIAALLTAGVSFGRSRRSHDKTLIVHHELFLLKDPNSTEDQNRLAEALQRLKKIEYHHTFIGMPASGSVGTFSVSLLTYFDSEKGQEIYKNHPIRQKILNDFNDLLLETRIYDALSS